MSEAFLPGSWQSGRLPASAESMAGRKPMRDIDQIIQTLKATHPGITQEQLRVLHPGADDDGLWFFRHPASPTEVQLASSTGQCPFLFETDAHDAPATAATVAEAVSLVQQGLGLIAVRV